MENPTSPKISPLRLAGIIAMFFGVQVLFVLGSYYFRRSSYTTPGMSRLEVLHVTIWLVVAANLLVLGGGWLRSLRQPRPTA
jgi:hypothetical protein